MQILGLGDRNELFQHPHDLRFVSAVCNIQDKRAGVFVCVCVFEKAELRGHAV